jgi:hypothetical protein
MAANNGYAQVTLKITGTSPLIVHNGQLADPLNKISKAMKAVTGKRKKVDADYEEMARLEFLGGLYLKDQRPIIPGVALEAMMINAAKKQRKGGDFKSGILIDDNPFIEYDGPTKPDDLWADERFRIVAGVKVGTSRVMRTRPMFSDWSLQFTVNFIEELINKRDIMEVAHIAGWQIGLCEWRPKFGRFTAQAVE